MDKNEKWENSIVAKQPVFDSKEEAMQYALRDYEKGDKFPEIFLDSDGERYIAAVMPATEILYRKGFEVIASFADLMKLRSMDRANKMAKSFDEIRESNDGGPVQ